MTDPRIYVACLASYNAGHIHGRWIDASPNVEDMQAEVRAMLRESPCPNVTVPDWEATARAAGWGRNDHNGYFTAPLGHEIRMADYDDWKELCEAQGIKPIMVPSAEEYAIHDYEGLGSYLGEYAGLNEVALRAAIIEAVEPLGIPVEVALEYALEYCDPREGAEDYAEVIEENYFGVRESWADFAQELVEETRDMSEVPNWLQGHIDWESIGRDLRLSGDFTAFEHDGDLYFFRTV